MNRAGIVLFAGVILSLSAFAKDMVVSAQERKEIMSSARVWENPGDISQLDMLQGPGKKFKLHQNVTCKFFDGLYTKLDGTGATPKFWCVEPGKDPRENIKVKYGSDNGEVFAEVVASRLLWALGFFADKAYPISVNCEHCPADPWTYLHHVAEYKHLENTAYSEARQHHVNYLLQAQENRETLNTRSLESSGKPYYSRYEMALSEGKYDGVTVTIPGDAKGGFGLNELSDIRSERGGSGQAETEALALLLAFIKHGDSKPANHRLVCPDSEVITRADGSKSCAHARLVLQDIGATFGNGSVKLLLLRFIMSSSKMDFKAWKATPVWDDSSACRARLKASPRGTLSNPTVSEAGRKFLARLLEQLTDRQITDMFVAARADQRAGKSASIAQWVELFKNKRSEIINARCPQ